MPKNASSGAFFCARLPSDRFFVSLRTPVKSGLMQMITKFYSKKQLYVAAGLSRTTFYRKLLELQPELAEMGVTRNQQLLPPDVVEYICQKVRINPASLP